MADKTYVSVKGQAKDVYDSALKSALVEFLEKSIAEAIDGKSSGKLTTKKKSDKGYLLTASLTLNADDEDKPRSLDAKIAFVVMAVGSTAKAFTGNATGAITGVGSDALAAAKDLIGATLEGFMPKVIKTIVAL